MFKKDWVVFVVYRDHLDRNNIKTVVLKFNKVTKNKAIKMAENEVCFKNDDGVGYRNVLLVKPVKARSWSF